MVVGTILTGNTDVREKESVSKRCPNAVVFRRIIVALIENTVQ